MLTIFFSLIWNKTGKITYFKSKRQNAPRVIVQETVTEVFTPFLTKGPPRNIADNMQTQKCFASLVTVRAFSAQSPV